MYALEYSPPWGIMVWSSYCQEQPSLFGEKVTKLGADCEPPLVKNNNNTKHPKLWCTYRRKDGERIHPSTDSGGHYATTRNYRSFVVLVCGFQISIYYFHQKTTHNK